MRLGRTMHVAWPGHACGLHLSGHVIFPPTVLPICSPSARQVFIAYHNAQEEAKHVMHARARDSSARHVHTRPARPMHTARAQWGGTGLGYPPDLPNAAFAQCGI